MPSRFRQALADLQPRGARPRRWVFVAYDQLNDRLKPLDQDPESLGIVLVEAPARAARRPYHRQKLALVLTNLRHFALEQARRGVAVRHVVSAGSYADALGPLVDELGPIDAIAPAERELREELRPLAAAGRLRVVPHTGWLTTPDEFRAWAGAEPPWRLDAFYRGARRARDILMTPQGPAGGRWSFDAENRRPWRGQPPAPTPPTVVPDEITTEVCRLVERHFGDHPGHLDPSALPASAEDARAHWQWALAACLPTFGPFEDAMSTRSSSLFHTRISALLNLHRLLPAQVVADALAADLPLPSVEGFVRQVLGWRELVRHVHRASDGFRAPGMQPGHLGAGRTLPAAYWGASSGLACLDRVVADVWRTGYSHHITRLMVLGNLAVLLDLSARELSDWFWIAYTDAYDWVVEPNVLAMATFAVGPLMTTKPYVAGAAYIDRMSDYCRGCAFDPKTTCPVTPLYWAFLDRHRTTLAANPRLTMPLAQLARRDAATRARDAAVVAAVQDALAEGRRVTPADLPPRRP